MKKIEIGERLATTLRVLGICAVCAVCIYITNGVVLWLIVAALVFMML